MLNPCWRLRSSSDTPASASFRMVTIWPFEILLIAHRSVARLPDLISSEVSALADILKRVIARYDNLFEISFPFSMGFHQVPFDGQPHPEWILHAHFCTALLRSAPSANSWLVAKCLPCPSVTSHPKPPPNACVRFPTCITSIVKDITFF